MHHRTIMATLLAASATLPMSAHAQTTAPAPTAGNTVAKPDEVASSSDDIIVTAQKRSENVQAVPISILAFDERALSAAGVTNPAELQRVAPTFKFTTSLGTLATRFSIRGIGTFGNSAIEPSVATFIDGIYVPRPASIVNSLLDIQGVEVLSGPQGTLFGRNASVGAVSYRTGTPIQAFAASLKTDYSTGAHSRTEGMINLPVSDTVAVRVAGLANIFGGYWKDDLTGDRFGGIDTYQGRVSLKAELTPSLTWIVRGDYQRNTGDGQVNSKIIPSTLTPTTLARLTALQGGIAPNLDQFSRTNNTYNGNYRVNDRTWDVTSDLSFDAGGFTLRLLDGYYDWDSRQSDGDTAALSTYVLGRNLFYNSKSDSHEFQVISPKDQLLGGKLDFVGGLYYFHEDLGIRADSLNGTAFCSNLVPNAALPFGSIIPGATTAARIATCQGYTGPSSRGDFVQSTRSLAAYGQATLEVIPGLDLTGGLRYTEEKKSGDYVGTVYNPTGAIIAANETTALALKDDRVTWRANLAWHPDKDVMLFGTVSTGFKSGGFNNGVATRALGQARVFQAETVTNYEVGFKTQFADRTVTLNLTAFRMDIDNFQERSIVSLLSTIRNVGQVRQQGLEFEGVVRPIPHLKLNTAVTFLDSKIQSYCNAPLPPYQTAPAPASCPGAAANTQNLARASLSYSPEWSGVVGATVDGLVGGWKWSLNGDMSFTSSQRTGTTIDNSPLVIQPGYALFNSRLTVTSPDDKYSLGLYARNITGKGYCVSKVYQVLEGPLGLRYDINGDGANDGTAVRCLVGEPRVIGVTAGVKF